MKTKSVQFVFPQADAMVPLVWRVLRDLVAANARLAHQERRLDLLEDCRHSTNYAVREQYYQSLRERNLANKDREDLIGELEGLGVTILDQRRGMVGFPFRWSRNVRSRTRRAHFLLKLWDDPEKGIQHWRFDGEEIERRVPSHWHGQFTSPVLAEAGSPRDR